MAPSPTFQKMTKAFNMLHISPDLYLRYFLGFQIIKNIQGTKPCKILDVGGKNGLLGHFIKSAKLPYKLFVSDILPDEKATPTLCDKYIKENFLKNKLKTQSFDFVTSFDVLEHVNNKTRFLEQIARVGKIAILSAPFKSPQINKAETLVNDFFKQYTNRDHPWLKEHFQVNLPHQKWFETFLKKRNYHFKTFGSNNLSNWLLFMLPNLTPSFFQINSTKLHEINRYYNKHFDKLGDLAPPYYRNIYIFGKNNTKIDKSIQTIPKKSTKPIPT